MNTHIPSILSGLSLTAALAFAGLASAQTDHQHPTHGTTASTPAAQAATSADLPWADAEVRRVDTAAGKISLRHGEIKNLEMPPMTMVFRVSDAAVLQQVKPGDKVRVQVQQIQGAYTVTALEPQP